jgi:hypothetical protein
MSREVVVETLGDGKEEDEEELEEREIVGNLIFFQGEYGPPELTGVVPRVSPQEGEDP